jgi:hypothetical protein
LRVTAVGAWALVVAGPAGATPIVLPSPAALVMPPPPLIAGTTPLESEQELRFPGHIRTVEQVVVGLRSDGSASSVVVTQRLLIDAVGDYSFTIPAPVLSVDPGPGTQSEPGQRNTGIVWQGFSSGQRLLVAQASLDPLPAERGLPLAIRLERRGDATVVRVIDIARRRVTITRGSASFAGLRALLHGVRVAVQAPDRTPLTRTLQVDGVSRGAETIVVDAPIRVRGSIAAGGRRVPVSWTLGAGRPLVREVSVTGAAPKLRLEAELLTPLELLPPDEKLTLRGLQVALARVALSAQYGQYLASPDQLGQSETSYVYRTVAEEPPSVPPELRPASGGGDDTLAIVLASVLGGVALVGLVVLWAHS